MSIINYIYLHDKYNLSISLYHVPNSFLQVWSNILLISFPLKKSRGIDLIIAEVARQLPKTALIHPNLILNFILRLSSSFFNGKYHL